MIDHIRENSDSAYKSSQITKLLNEDFKLLIDWSLSFKQLENLSKLPYKNVVRDSHGEIKEDIEPKEDN